MSADDDQVRYHFGPLEHRGLIAGWRGGQIVAVVTGLALALATIREDPSAATMIAALAILVVAAAVAFCPVAGRTGEEWVPTLMRWVMRRRRGDTGTGGAGALRPRSPTELMVGRHVAEGTTEGTRGPGIFHGLSIMAVPLSGREQLVAISSELRGSTELPGCSASVPEVAVIHDRMGATYTAVLAVKGHGFALLSPADMSRRVSAWSAVLAATARVGSPIRRLQWLACAWPDDGRAMRDEVLARADTGASRDALRSYADLMAQGGRTTTVHRVLVAVQLTGRSARSERVRSGARVRRSKHETAMTEICAELARLAQLITHADLSVCGALSPGALAQYCASLYQPAPNAMPWTGVAGVSVDERQRMTGAGSGWDRQGVSQSETFSDLSLPERNHGVSLPEPNDAESEWSSFRTDGTWHASYWIAEWPRRYVGPDFLGPLVLGSVRRTVSVVLEPLPPSQAVRMAERARTADLADGELRRRGGFLSTARRRKETELAVQREAELAAGHSSFRFSGYVTVTAPSPWKLAQACDTTEQAASHAGLELRRLVGDQDRGFACALPLCRGLS